MSTTLRTHSSSFGVSKRESHNADSFYGRRLFSRKKNPIARCEKYDGDYGWANQVYCGDARTLDSIPDCSVGLVFTSPPYNVGKDYDTDMAFHEYLCLLRESAREVMRVLVSGGRLVINLAGIGRKPYIPLQAHTAMLLTDIGFVPMGDIIWRKAVASSGNCAWGSWKSAKSPVLRDVHEYLLIFGKDTPGRPDKGTSTISKEDFMSSTTSVWEVQPESAKRIGHPAPFPIALAERVIDLYSYQEDVVLDPFNGAGTTCVAASRLGRKYVGYDNVQSYVDLAVQRLSQETVRSNKKST